MNLVVPILNLILSFTSKYIYIKCIRAITFVFIERDSEQRSMSLWERSGCSDTSISSMLQKSIYQVASSRKFKMYLIL